METRIKKELLEIVERSYISFVNNEFVQNIKEEIELSPICRNRVLSLFVSSENVSKYFNDTINKTFGVWVNRIVTEMEEYLQKSNFDATEIFDRDCISRDIIEKIAYALISKSVIDHYGYGFATPVEPSKISIVGSAVCERFARFIDPSVVLKKVEANLQEYKSDYVVNHVKDYFSKLFEQSFGEESPMFNKSIENDYGKGFLFSMKTLDITEDDLKKYKSGNLKEPYDKYQYGNYRFQVCDVMVYTDGFYPKVIRLSKDIPTFDSGDREYDSWHDLYLVQEQNGNIHAVYCTGGYRIAKLQGYAKVHKYPDGLKQYFET